MEVADKGTVGFSQVFIEKYYKILEIFQWIYSRVISAQIVERIFGKNPEVGEIVDFRQFCSLYQGGFLENFLAKSWSQNLPNQDELYDQVSAR